MSTFAWVQWTGLVALAINVHALSTRHDHVLRRSSGLASALWALNNLLLGAHSAAALSLLSVGRQATASVVQGRRQRRVRALSCIGFLAITLVIAVVTWNGMTTVCTALGSALATIAMFFLRGVRLRVTMALVAVLWMVNAVAYDAWWQLVANTLACGAASLGAWRLNRAQAAAPSAGTPTGT